MTDEELAAIEARAKGVPYSGISVTPDETLALVAEVRRLRAQMGDPENWPVGYCAVCDTAMRQSPNGQWWHEDTAHDHVAVHEDAYR